jgi:hypothetical protein
MDTISPQSQQDILTVSLRQLRPLHFSQWEESMATQLRAIQNPRRFETS